MRAAWRILRWRLTIVVTAMTWSGSVAWRMPRKNPRAMMDSKVPIYFESEANTRETVRQRSNDSRDPATPSPVLAENLKKSMFGRTAWRLRLAAVPSRFYNVGDRGESDALLPNIPGRNCLCPGPRHSSLNLLYE